MLNAELLQLFIYCLLRANHKDTEIIWNGKPKKIKRGSFLTGLNTLCIALKQKQTATYNRLKVLKELNYIDVKSENKFSVVTIVNYNTYQVVEDLIGKQNENKVKTNGKQSETDKNDNNVDNDKMKELEAKPPNLPYQCKTDFENFYREKKGVSYDWQGKDWGAVKGVIKKLKSNYHEKHGRDPTDDECFNAFAFVIRNINDDWIMENLEMALINSKFSTIKSKFKIKNIGSTNKTELEDWIRNRTGT